MNRTWLILRHEVSTNVSRRSWLLATFGVPLVAAALTLVISLRKGAAAPAASAASAPAASSTSVEGFVDHSGLVTTIPEDAQGELLPFPSEAEARRAMQAREISAYYVVPHDYLARGDLLRIDPGRGLLGSGQPQRMQWTLLVNLLGGDQQEARLVWQPMELTVKVLDTSVQRQVGVGAGYWVPYICGFLLYVSVILSSSLLRSSLGQERLNRLQEVLLLSVSPRQLLAGKIVGLGLVGLLQTAVWMGSGYALLTLSGQALSLQIPATLLVWGALYFLLGYALYASALAGLGALTGPNNAGSSTADFVVVWPLIIPISFIPVLIQKPQGALSVALSLFPPTAPVAMMTRLSVEPVPAWQLGLSVGLMLVTAALVVRAVVRIFRAQTLLSGETFTTRRYFAALLGKE